MNTINGGFNRNITRLFFFVASWLFAGRRLSLYFLLLTGAGVHAQCLVPSTSGDSLFPVTNKYNTLYSIFGNIIYNSGADIFNIASDNKGKYYLFGDFGTLSQNHGPALVIDTATNTIKTPQKWKVNGIVLTAISDGQGGFFIGGDFTRIGDSIRKYIARVDANGRPTAWNPKADDVVRIIQNRNDTLYIAGDFSTFLSRPRTSFAMYSVTGDSLLRSRLIENPITSILLLKDTLIYSCSGSGAIRKYNIRDSLYIPWQLPYTEYGPVDELQFNVDSSVIIYRSRNNGNVIKAFKRSTGALHYSIAAPIVAMKSLGTKVFAVGYFSTIQQQPNTFARKGFFSFDGTTGQISPDDLHIDGYTSFLGIHNGKLFLSGSFSIVNSVNRLNFAVVDTGTLNVGPWQLSPSNALTSLAFNNGNAFIGGHFNGINAVKRNGYAAIDSATGTILPWSPSNLEFTEGKRMQIKGDTIFVLGITGRPSSCMINDFNTAFRMYRLSDGQQLPTTVMNFSKICDFIIDSGYLYVSGDKQLRRYSLPSLTRDLTWGVNFNLSGADHTPIYLIARGNTIYSVGDNRFEQQCTQLPTRKGWIIKYNKSTGIPATYFSYLGPSSYYDQVTFDHALLINNKIYIQGYFNALNGKPRRNFACIDINSGAVTDWETPFSQTRIHDAFRRSSDLKLHNGKIWFGSPTFTDSSGKRFPGFGAIDTTSGILMPSVFRLYYTGMENEYYGKTSSFHDFIFTNERLIGVGGFDFVDSIPYSSLVSLQLMQGSPPVATPTTIIGPDTVYSNNQPNKFFITPSAINLYSYNWSYSGSGVSISNNGSDTVWIRANSSATNGNLIVNAINYCGSLQLAQKAIIVAAPPPALPVPVVSGISDKCFTDPNAYAKLNNPPFNVSISVLLDGIALNYNAADSSFQYFTSQQTVAGVHTVRVKYKYTYATRDSVMKDFAYAVKPKLTPLITIAGNTIVNSGDATNLSSSVVSGGTNPGYQWQDSTQSHTWQNITSGTNQTISYRPAATGDKLRCILTSNAICVSPATATSNRLSFTVNIITAINPSPAISKTIRLYPNPASANIIIDTLQLSDKWKSLEIIDMTGQKIIINYSIENKTRLIIPVGQLSSGMYILVLRKKNGVAVFKPFLKK